MLQPLSFIIKPPPHFHGILGYHCAFRTLLCAFYKHVCIGVVNGGLRVTLRAFRLPDLASALR